MSRTFTHRLGTNLDKFPEDKIIVYLGSNHAPTDRYQIVHPGEQKPRYPDTRAKNLNEVRSMARLLIRRHEERAKFVRRRPARPDDIITTIDGQWYCMCSNGKLYSTKNTREMAISYAKKAIANSMNTNWYYTTVTDRLAATNIFARM